MSPYSVNAVLRHLAQARDMCGCCGSTLRASAELVDYRVYAGDLRTPWTQQAYVIRFRELNDVIGVAMCLGIDYQQFKIVLQRNILRVSHTNVILNTLIV
jgi:hypothetical protein